MPHGEAYERFLGLIARLARRFSTPAFPPHVTLLAGIGGRPEDDLLAACRRLAADLRPLEISLSGVEGRDEPFRCLFAPAALDGPLLAAHAAAARAFDREPDPAFFPHLSLVYGTLPAAVKRQVATETAPLVTGSCRARRLHVWRTDGPAVEWREIGVFVLGGLGEAPFRPAPGS
jgi:2'-5' RNA ligase superfamily